MVKCCVTFTKRRKTNVTNRKITCKPAQRSHCISVSDNNVVSVKGPLGELTQSVDKDLKIEVVDNQIIIDQAHRIEEP